jgi:hypothetical protein
MYGRLGIGSFAGCILALALLAWLIRHRDRPQFRLKSVFALLLIFACLCGWASMAIRYGQIVVEPANDGTMSIETDPGSVGESSP